MTLYTHTHLYKGADRRALAIHCSLSHTGAWRGAAAALKGDLSLLAYDLPSHGKSGVWDRTGNVHDEATDMARALVSEPMDLIGHSFGATVALRLAVENPELVRSLTLIEPVYFAVVAADEPELIAQHREGNAEMDAAFAAGDEHEAARIFNRGWGDGTPWNDLPERLREHMTRLVHFVPAGGKFIFEDSAGLMAPGRLAQAAMPTLLLEGDQSPPLSAKVNIALQKRLPDAERVVLKGVGHMLPVTHPESIVEPVRSLLARS